MQSTLPSRAKMLRSPLAADFQGVHTIVHASSIYGVATVYSIWQIIQTRCGGDGILHAHWWVVCTEPMVCTERLQPSRNFHSHPEFALVIDTEINN